MTARGPVRRRRSRAWSGGGCTAGGSRCVATETPAPPGRGAATRPGYRAIRRWGAGRDAARRKLLHHRVGARAPVRDTERFGDAGRVAHEVWRPQRVHALEEPGRADRERQDPTHAAGPGLTG